MRRLVLALLLSCGGDEGLPPGWLCQQDSDCEGFCLRLERESYCSVPCAYGCYDNCDEHNDPDFMMVCEMSDQSSNGWACVAHLPSYIPPDLCSSQTTNDPTDQPDPPCCKTCGVGSKPCGDTCILDGYTCHVGAGCAC